MSALPRMEISSADSGNQRLHQIEQIPGDSGLSTIFRGVTMSGSSPEMHENDNQTT